ERVANVEWLHRRRFGGWIPECDNIVGPFATRGEFHQVNVALTPIASRFDPDAGHVVIRIKQVLVTRELPIALQKAEAAHIVGGAGPVLQRRRIDQWTPEKGPVLLADGKAIRVMNLRPIVVRLYLRVFPEPKHTRQGRNADCFKLTGGCTSEVKESIHVDHC